MTTQRNDKKKGRITKQNEDKLNSIGFHWARSDDKFLVRCSEVLVGIKNTTDAAGTYH